MTDTDRGPLFVLSNRYEVVAEIGRGGFSLVYCARDRVLARDVAVKILRADSLPRGASERFQREMEVTARLEHPNILHVYDTGLHDGAPFFVMEFVRGSTLEARLAQEHALPVSDALVITQEIGAALAFAHASRVVHRDVKPANILLGTSGALLGDFGIAHILGDDLVNRITSMGFAVGTTLYMSPEQLCAEPIVDMRSDQYSLALVTYEMLTGVRPHSAATVDALRALRIAGALVPVRAHRPAVPVHVDEAIIRALAPAPADRFRDVREFLLALDGQPTGERTVVAARISGTSHAVPLGPPATGNATTTGGEHPFRRRSRVVVASAALLATVGYAATQIAQRGAHEGGDPDNLTPSVAVIALNPSDTASVTLVVDELAMWDGVVVRRPANDVRINGDDSLRAVAATLRASVLIRASRTVDGEACRWTFLVFDAKAGQSARLTQGATRAGPSCAGPLRELVMRSLIGASADSAPGLSQLHEPRLIAAEAYADAWQQLRTGRIDSARTLFAASAASAPTFSQAQLWRAQVNAWLTPKAPAEWRDAARLAISGDGALRGRDSLVAVGLLAMASGNPPAACDAYRRAIASDPDSFLAWFGLGECQRLDSIVVRDARSANGMSFRSSHWNALSAYSEALRRMPSGGLSMLFERVVPLTYAAPSRTRIGIALAPDSGHFIAFPSLAADTLQTIPVQRDALLRMKLGTLPESFNRAVERGRQSLLDFTSRWIAQSPASPHAWFHRAYALELTGAFDAPDLANSAARVLARADSLAVDDEFRAALDVARVRVAVRRDAFDEAMRLARAALSRPGPLSARAARVRAPLAAFLGDDAATVALLRIGATSGAEREQMPDWTAARLTPALADKLRDFGVRAALGHCDGLAARRDSLEAGMSQEIAAADLHEQRVRLLHGVYRMAVPCLGPSSVREFPVNFPLDSAIGALAAGELAHARAILDGLDRTRRGTSIAALTQEMLLAETWLRLQTGDTVGAVARVRADLGSIANLNPFTFDNVMQAGALPQIRKLVSVH